MLKGTAPGITRSTLTALLVGALLAALLGGCASSTNAPVVDRKHRSQSTGRQKAVRPVTSGSYVVRPKDTLYSIAFRFGRDWKELAASNGIAAPYTIKPGQVIHLSRRPATATRTATPARQTASTARPAAKPAAKPAASKPVASKPAPAKPVPAAVRGKWLWPAEGTVISRYSSSTTLNKGIDIAGKIGQPVRSTAKGTVVYAGSDLRGYGELIIIKHDDTFISAYGHNRRLLVNEGQQVAAGQQIAEMGSTGTDRVKLHFEIRRQGTPVDPLKYLPAR